MQRLDYDSLIRSLLLIRFGQELGTAGPVTAAIHDFLDAVAAVVQFLR